MVGVEASFGNITGNALDKGSQITAVLVGEVTATSNEKCSISYADLEKRAGEESDVTEDDTFISRKLLSEYAEGRAATLLAQVPSRILVQNSALKKKIVKPKS